MSRRARRDITCILATGRAASRAVGATGAKGSRRRRGPLVPSRPVSDVDAQLEILTAGTVHCIDTEELRTKLASGRRLRVKLGIDPTASDIHLGHTVVLHKLRQFQDLGHLAVLIIGDFTARVGDPTGRSATRPPLTAAEVETHAATYVEQVRAVLDFDPDRIELVYPLLQGTDSVEVRADVELGGTDQLFNNLMGRQLQSAAGMEPQVVITTPLLEGLDGEKKMSKSLANYVGISEPPAEQFGKIMSIPDPLMPRYF